MVPPSTLVPVEEPIPVPDLTPVLIPGIHPMSVGTVGIGVKSYPENHPIMF